MISTSPRFKPELGVIIPWVLNLCPVGPKRGPSCELIAEFYLVDRGLRHRLPGFSSMGRLVDDKGDYYFGFFPPIALAHFSNHPMTTTTG